MRRRKSRSINSSNIAQNTCDTYGICCAFGSCNPQDSPACTCLPGFGPNNPTEWAAGNWSSGCARKIPLSCEFMNSGSRQQDGFFDLERMKFPNYTTWWLGPEYECRGRCLNNCSCIAYAYNSGVGCMFWTGILIDTHRFPGGSGLHTYIRVADSELGEMAIIRTVAAACRPLLCQPLDLQRLVREKGFNKTKIILVLIGFTIIMSVCACILWKWLAKRRGAGTLDSVDTSRQDTLSDYNLQELPLFEFAELANVTSKFSDSNKLGKGGFGPVYKGVLANGEEIAVKRLSKASGQGMQEFMNEVLLISKLQHRNLVRLLGCSVENNEKMLIYEYMPNKSLDFFLFDASQEILDWGKRFNIIEGICRGLL
ncbi:hypothetical protein OROHE_010416 [Orobanche hederae]